MRLISLGFFSMAMLLTPSHTRGEIQGDAIAQARMPASRGRGRAHYGPNTVDLDKAARDLIYTQTAKQIKDHQPQLGRCIREGERAGEPAVDRAILKVRVDGDGGGHPLSMRLEGGFAPVTQGCLWQLIQPWRYAGLPKIQTDVDVTVRLLPREGEDKATPLPSSQAAPDRTRGLVELVSPPQEVPDASAGQRHAVLTGYVADLSACFEPAWATAPWRCEGAMNLPLVLEPDGSASTTAPASWFYPSQSQTPEGAAAPAPSPADALEAPTPTADPQEGSTGPSPQDPDLRGCPTSVQRCIASTVSIWQLPPAPERGSCTLRVLVSPPHRLDDTAPPAGWAEANQAAARGMDPSSTPLKPAGSAP